MQRIRTPHRDAMDLEIGVHGDACGDVPDLSESRIAADYLWNGVAVGRLPRNRRCAGCMITARMSLSIR
ncbi:hypothetical protein [Rhodococcus qingshengii]|uniref:hypothetical protein n=1 Tax=Rhodococcus qingshengii TaxID=334542 RepID=UPI001BE6E680|nr:hypothetical protein [Rhodococcus qingshengii]MBT2272203.1 hypothetical protein [Rhodococcus qingshengii]